MRKVCVYTGTRAEYGLLKPLIDEIKESSKLKLQLIVSGTHLSHEFGSTYRVIEKEGIKIDEKVEILLSSDTSVGISKSMGLGMIGYAEAIDRLKPDIAVVLGDRYETFSFTSACMIAKIPIAHIHGGEITEGAFDDAIRHSITKMSHLHFTSTAEYRKRVIQLGEQPDRVFNVGAIGIDNIKKLKLLSKSKLEKIINFKFGKRNILITFHPVTLERNSSERQFKELLSTVDKLEDTKIIFTNPNSDTDGRIIITLIEEYAAKNKDRVIALTSMGQLKYLSAMQYVDAVVGNSSSGIIETPSFKIGTVNIGDRQKGRIAAESVIHCLPEKNDILKAFIKIYSDEFKSSLKSITNPYGKGNTAPKIIKILEDTELKNIIKKSFYSINND